MENKPTNSKPTLEQLVHAIKDGHITMRPKWHFVLKTILGILGLTVLLLTIVYLTSFILFTLWRTGVWDMPIFGARGWYEFLVSLPWLLIFLLLLFFITLEILVRQYAFAYRRPLLYSAAGVLVVIAIAGYSVARSPLHQRLFISAERHHLPFGGEHFYRAYDQPRSHKIHRGVIREINPAGFMMDTMRHDRVQVIITRRTRLPLGAEFANSDDVIVFGERQEAVIQAFGVRKMSE